MEQFDYIESKTPITNSSFYWIKEYAIYFITIFDQLNLIYIGDFLVSSRH